MVLRMDPAQFLALIAKAQDPLVVVGQTKRKWWERGKGAWRYDYLTVYKGFLFGTTTQAPLELPRDAEVVAMGPIRLPK
jgi:hypothetical protein